jgi:hypothetical protein
MPDMRTTRLPAKAAVAFFLLSWIVGDGLGAAEPDLAEPFSFERNVLPVLSKAGCNAGTCHGNVNGKGGFFLSLRGQDPELDFRQLVHQAGGRRIDRFSPRDSLLLVKATSQVAHEGGQRFSSSSPEYQLLVDWIRGGTNPPNADAPRVQELIVDPIEAFVWMPEREVQLSVFAKFSDGSVLDVSRLAVYESSDPTVQISPGGLVQFSKAGATTVLIRYLDGQAPIFLACREGRDDFQWREPAAQNWIDPMVHARLRQLKIQPAGLASDSVFLRRLSLDLLGVLPTAEEAREFMADPNPEKRNRIIDGYLARPEFAAMWAQKWSDLVRSEEKTLDAQGVQRLHGWMLQQFSQDLPLNEFASQLILSRGSTYENPPANYWRAHREPLVRAETTAQVFLGVRLQCAKCHNHPFDRWSQDEYYHWASLFEGIEYEIVANDRKDNLDKHEFVGDQIVLVKAEGMVKNARTGQSAPPRLLGMESQVDGDRLHHLASWMASSDNRLFARAQVNRIWYHTMGVGLVEPVDDLRATNPPWHPELLERLTDEFIASGFSLKHLVRTIVSSRTYQLDSNLDRSQLGEGEQLDARLLAQAVVRRLTAEQLMDAQSQILGVAAHYEGYPAGSRALDIAGVERVRRSLSPDDGLLRKFGKPERLLSCECERSNEATLGQALSLIGGQSLNERLRQTDNRIGKLLNLSLSHHERIEELYWTALTRPPSAEELSSLTAFVEQAPKPRDAFEDIVWALLNAKELIFRN